MKLFCSTCKEEVTDNIAVYENVDGFTIHCGTCNEPIVQLAFDDPWLQERATTKEQEETQMSLFDDLTEKPPAFQEEDEPTQCDCIFCQAIRETEAPVYEEVVFTTADLEIMSKTLNRRANSAIKTYDQIIATLDKVNTLLGYRQCL